jgi:hypothetical protein
MGWIAIAYMRITLAVFGCKSLAAVDSVDAAWLCKTREVPFCE